MQIEYIEVRKDPRIGTEVEITYFTRTPPANIDDTPTTGNALNSFLTELGPDCTRLLRDQPYRARDMLILDTHNGARRAHRGQITPTTIVSPSAKRPLRIASASGFSSRLWIARRNGRAP
jgi:hypothetical protein